MPQKLHTFRNGGSIEFDSGCFDEWCVFVTHPGQERFAPKDVFYFRSLLQISEITGPRFLYDDFVVIYNRTTQSVDGKVFELISSISRHYENFAQEIEVWFSVIYAGMIAEENKKNAILRKRIKRLGMYQVFVEGIPPEEAAVFSKGKRWQELDALMKERGF